MKKKPFSLVLPSALLAVLMLWLLPGRATALGGLDPSRAVSLTLSSIYDGSALPDVRVRIYRVAKVTASGSFSLTEEFAATKVDVSGKTDLAKVAQTLPGGIALNGIAPIASGSSGQGGELSFPGLEAGLYLVLADRTGVGGYTYIFSPTLLALPSQSGGLWEYDVTASVKPERVPGAGSGQPTSYQAVKRWADLDHEEERPDHVTVEILKDGVHDSTQILSRRNNWTCRWSDEGGDGSWLVAERDIAKGYTVTAIREGGVFVVTNSYTEDLGEGEAPEGGSPGVSPSPGEPSAEIPEESTPANGGPSSPGLPQTGQLWWPVPLMSGLGLVLFGVGYAMRRKGGGRHEE